MNKTININLGGFPFVIDEEAYNTLHLYLENIKKHFSKSEGADEIVSDIEDRIAELFNQSLGSRIILNNADVKKMIGVMGTPEDFGAENKGSESTYQSTNNFKTGKRLFRDPDDKIVGGVCSGISAYLGIEDPIWLRAAFAISFFVFGSGFFVYIILLMILPKAETSADKLSMKGEHINIENIAKIVEDGVNHISSTINEVGNNLSGTNSTHTKHKLNDTLSNIVAMLGKVFLTLLAVIQPIIKMIGILVLFVLGLVLLALFMSLIFGFPLVDYFYEGNTLLGGLTFANLFFLIGIPVLGIIFLLTKLLFNYSYTPKWSNGLKIFFWVNFGALFFLLPFGFRNFSHSGTETTSFDKKSDTLLIKINTKDADDFNINFGDLGIKEGFIEISNNIDLNIETTTDSVFTIEKKMISRGRNEEQAKKNAKNTVYNIEIKGNELVLDKTFLIPKGSLWRGQKVKITVKVPNNKIVGMSGSTYNFANEMNTDVDVDWEDDIIKYLKSNAANDSFE